MNTIQTELFSTGNSIGISMGLETTSKVNSPEKNKDFGSLLNESIEGLEDSQLSTQEMVTELLTTGEGDSSQTLMAMNEAASKIKMAAVYRDKLIENYQTIMNIQI